MRRCCLFVFAAVAAACGNGSSSTTGPSPAATKLTINGQITDTVSGRPIGSFSGDATTLPTRVTVSAAGYLTRESVVSSPTPTVDLIPDAAPFSLVFFRQMARATLESPIDELRVLAKAPAIYLQVAGLTPANVAALEQAARSVVPALTGGRFEVTTFETGDAARPEAAGWIVAELLIELPNRSSTACGMAKLGASAGHLWLSIAARCKYSFAVEPSLMGHELGHALGFSHVDNVDALMHATVRLAPIGTSVPVSDAERYHGAIAYHRSAGSRDVDVDPTAVASVQRVLLAE